jgi:uncharacterized SAM-binding protein YcdF (DUF218 family)
MNPAVSHSSKRFGLFRSSATGLLGAAAFAIAFALITWLQAGAAMAARTATEFAMPVGMLWSLLLAAVIHTLMRRQWMSAFVFAICWLGLAVGFNGWLAGRWIKTLEYDRNGDALETIEQPLDAVIVLGGYARLNRFEVAEVTCDGERIVSAAQLWHAGKVQTIVCTGSGGAGAADPATLGRDLLVSMGVPDEAIFEVPGENTSQEMIGLRQFFDSPPPDWQQKIGDDAAKTDRVGLITSAFHMPRALRLAGQQALDFVPLPCSFRGGKDGQFTPRDLVPTAAAGKRFAIAWKETLARLVGR